MNKDTKIAIVEVPYNHFLVVPLDKLADLLKLGMIERSGYPTKTLEPSLQFKVEIMNEETLVNTLLESAEQLKAGEQA